MLKRRRVKNDVRLELGQEPKQPLTIADIRDTPDDRRLRSLDSESFQDGMQSRLGILDDQELLRTEGDGAVADLRANRAAAAGDYDRPAIQETFQPPIVDFHGWPQ